MKSSSSCSSSTLTTTLLMILVFLSHTTFGHQHEDGEPCSDDFADLKEQWNLKHCKKLRTLGAEFGWNYYENNNATIDKSNLTDNNTARIDILFRAKLNSYTGWVAWGVNPGKKAEMVGTQAIIAKRQNNGIIRADPYNLTKETKFGCALIKPSHNIGFKVLNITSNLTCPTTSCRHRPYIYISATLILPSDAYNITRLNHVWQVGENAVGDEDQILQHKTTLHNLDSAETINLTSPTGTATQKSPDFLRSVHGVLNIIGWGTLLPFGVIIARYFRVYPIKWNPTWKYLHIGFQLSGFIIGTIAWIIGLSLGNATKHNVLYTHRAYGILIFVFTTLQMLAFRLKPKPTDNYRKYWNMYHHFLGYGLITLIIINIFKGIHILHGGPGWKWTYIGILSLLGFITLVFEIVTCVRFFLFKEDKPYTIGSDNKGDDSAKKLPDKPKDTPN